MGRMTAYLLRQFRQWETGAQIGFILAVLLVIPAAVVASNGPENLRQPALIGTMGLLITAQAIFMWANRHMVTPFTQAQRAYLRGDFMTARHTLEDVYESGKADMRTLTLLGNTYRQLGMLVESEAILYEAVNNHPDHYFPLYGFGRTLLVKGDYVGAVNAIAQAIEQGAPPAVQVDVGEAYFRQQDHEAATRLLQAAESRDDPQRELMRVYLLYRMGKGEQPGSDLIAAGLDYWTAQARLFAQTSYGAALAADIETLRSLAQERNSI